MKPANAKHRRGDEEERPHDEQQRAAATGFFVFTRIFIAPESPRWHWKDDLVNAQVVGVFQIFQVPNAPAARSGRSTA